MTPHGEGFSATARLLVFWATHTVSGLGTGASQYALAIWLAVVKYPSAADQEILSRALLGLFLVSVLPATVLAPLLGTWMEPRSKRRVMAGTDAACAVLSLLLAPLIAWEAQFPAILAVLFALSLGNTLNMLAMDATFPAVIRPKDLPRANAMLQFSWAGTGLVAPLLGAGLLALASRLPLEALGLWGPSARYFVVPAFDGLTYVVSVCGVLLVRFPDRSREAIAEAPFFASLADGFAYLRHHRWLPLLLVGFAACNFAEASFPALLPIVLRRHTESLGQWGLTMEDGFALAQALCGVGALVASAGLMFSGSPRRWLLAWIVVPLMTGALAQVGVGLAPNLAVLAIALAVFAAAAPVGNTYSQVLWQTEVPEDLRARVFSVRRGAAQVTVPLGAAAAGLLASSLSVAQVLAGLGTMALVTVGALGLVINKRMATPPGCSTHFEKGLSS